MKKCFHIFVWNTVNSWCEYSYMKYVCSYLVLFCFFKVCTRRIWKGSSESYYGKQTLIRGEKRSKNHFYYILVQSYQIKVCLLPKTPVMIFCLWESWLWLWMLRRNICVTLYPIARKFQLYNGELLRIYSHFEIAKIFFRFKVRFPTKMEQVRRKVARKRKITSLHQCPWRSLIKSHCQRSLQIVMVRQKKHVQCHFLFVASRLPAFGPYVWFGDL